MKKQASLFSNTAVLGIMAFFSKAMTFLLMPFYTARLSPADFGQADLLISTALFLLPFVSLNMPEAVFRFVAGGERDKKEVITVGVALLLLGVGMFLCLFPLLMSSEVLSRYRYHLLFYVIASLSRSFLAHLLRAEGKYFVYAVQQFACALLTVLLQIFLLSGAYPGAGGYLLGVILGDSLVFFVLLLVLRPWRYISVAWIGRGGMRVLLFYALPLIPTAVLWWITSISDRYFLLHYHGSEAMGLYAAASRIPTALTFFVGIFLEAWQYTAIGVGEGTRGVRYGQIYSMLLPVGIAGAAAMLCMMYPVKTVVYAPEYGAVTQFIPLLTLAALFSAFSSFFSSVYTVTLKSSSSLWTALIGAALNLLLNAWLIPSLGGIGASLATLLSYFTIFLLRALHTGHYVAFSRHWGKLTLSLSYLSLAALAVTCGEYGVSLLPAVLSVVPFGMEIFDIFQLLFGKAAHFMKKRPKMTNKY
ncbi:MAG: polysaccharide biosynthesis C-terminal domain-containing protein [Clostridia bacterium]|nr:polysaccharide biosynthesis C-terminal domain-containing protein [Clostridia bacterium]